MDGQVETERKYELAPGQQLPSLAALATEGPVTSFDLVATYYDSPDCRLARARRVLRRREGGHDEGWHLKLPGERADERLELQAPLAHRRPPAELRELVEDLLAGAALVPLATLRTHRSELQLLGVDGALLAVTTTDDVVATAGPDRQEWREAEVELAAGDPALLDQVEAVLAAAGIPRSGSASKGGQALRGRIAAAEAADPAAAGTVLLDYAGRQLGTLQANEAATRADGPDAVHKSRVATRRLRSTLKTYAGVLGPGVDRLRAELRWHAELLGAARDAEVLTERLAAALAELPQPVDDAVTRLVSDSLARTHGAAHTRLVESMDTERYEALHAGLEGFLTDPGLPAVADEPAKVVLTPMLGQAVRRVRRLARRAAAQPGDLGLWHEVRKAAKAARYGAEVLVPVLGDRAEDWRARWEAVTEALGAVQDCVVAQAVIGDLAASAAAQQVPVRPLAELARGQQQALAEALLVSRKALRKALAERPRDT